MRVGPDLDGDAELFRLAAVPPVEVQAVWIGVELYGDSHLNGFLQHRFHVDRVRLAREQQSTRRMRQDGEVWIVERSQYAFRHRVTIHTEPRMNRSDHVVAALENPGVVIQSPIGQNIGFDSLEDAEFLHLSVETVDLL